MTMKKLFTLIILAFALAGTSCAQGKADKETDKQATAEVIPMDRQMFLDKVFDYTGDTTEWQYIGKKPAIIDFYATWCGPCRMISPILKSLAKEYADSIVVYKVDVDKEKQLAGEMGIQSLPTVLFIPRKGQPQVIVGAADKETFRRAIREVLLKE